MKEEQEIIEEKPNSFWYKIYAVVLIFAVVIISILGIFSNYYSQ